MPISETGSDTACRPCEGGGDDRGFTLVELMVVMAIVGLLSAVVVLQMPSGGGAPVAEARRLVSVLEAARTEAVVDARAVRLRFGGGAPVAEQRRRGTWVAIPPKQAGLAGWPAEVATSPGVLLFDPTGTVSGASEVVLTRGGEAARLLIDAEGTIRVGG